MMTNKKHNRQRKQSEASSASSSDEKSPAAKKSNLTDATRCDIPAIMSAQALHSVSQEPSIGQIWQVLMKIQADVTTILNDNQELRKDVENLKTSMQFHAEMVDALKTQNEKLVSTNNALHSEVFDLGKRVQTLEYEHDALEQYTRKFNIEIRGIPEFEGENLQDIVIKTGQRMSVNVTTEDVDIAHRLYRKSPAIKPIIVRFTTHKKRREFYKGRFNLKEANTTEIIGSTQGDTEGRIFINENLTQYRQEILAKARKMKRAYKINRVWTVDGKIFVWKTEESRPLRISEGWELEELAT